MTIQKKSPNDMTIGGILDAPNTINDLTQSTITIVSDIVISFGSTVA